LSLTFVVDRTGEELESSPRLLRPNINLFLFPQMQ
jgi:hypothetical protein